MTTRLTVVSLVLMGSLLVLAGCGGAMGGDKEMMKKDEMKKEEMKKDRMMKEEMMKKSGMMEKPSDPSSSGHRPAPDGSAQVRSARLSGIGNHQASGIARVATRKPDAATLTLADLSVDRVPDGRVYLAKGGDYTRAVELGKLMQFSGTAVFQIPQGVMVEDYDSVVIWCRQFNVGIGQAFFSSPSPGKDAGKIEKDMTSGMAK